MDLEKNCKFRTEERAEGGESLERLSVGGAKRGRRGAKVEESWVDRAVPAAQGGTGPSLQWRESLPALCVRFPSVLALPPHS